MQLIAFSFGREPLSDVSLTQLMAVAAGEIFEKLTVADRSVPAGTGEGGAMSDTRP